ncbi:MAG: glycosyltransferase, partial [Chitinophagaceae bacterium]
MKQIAVVLPVYNGMKYLSLAVESVLQQTYTDFVFLICDDCSTDSSWEYLNSLKDDRISLF